MKTGALVVVAVFSALLGASFASAQPRCPNTYAESCRCPAGCEASNNCERICVLQTCFGDRGIYRCTKCMCDTTIGACPVREGGIERLLGLFASEARAAEPAPGRIEASNEHGDFVVLDRKAMDGISDSSAGVGIALTVREGRAYVDRVPEGTAAHGAGIRPGDELVSVDGRRAVGKSPAQLAAELRGRDGTLVVLVVERKKTKRKLNLIRSSQSLQAAAGRADVTAKRVRLATLKTDRCPEKNSGCALLMKDGDDCLYTCPREAPR